MIFYMKLDIAEIPSSKNTVEFEFRKNLLDEDECYEELTQEYIDFAEQGGWIISIDWFGGGTNSKGWGVSRDELGYKLDRNVLKEVFEYVNVYSFPQNINEIIEFIWKDLYNNRISEEKAQEKFNKLGTIISNYYKELKEFSK